MDIVKDFKGKILRFWVLVLNICFWDLWIWEFALALVKNRPKNLLVTGLSNLSALFLFADPRVDSSFEKFLISS